MTLASLRQQRYSVRAIARWLGRSSSTMGRELVRRNRARGYVNAIAQMVSHQRGIDTHPLPKLHPDGVL